MQERYFNKFVEKLNLVKPVIIGKTEEEVEKEIDNSIRGLKGFMSKTTIEVEKSKVTAKESYFEIERGTVETHYEEIVILKTDTSTSITGFTVLTDDVNCFIDKESSKVKRIKINIVPTDKGSYDRTVVIRLTDLYRGTKMVNLKIKFNYE